MHDLIYPLHTTLVTFSLPRKMAGLPHPLVFLMSKQSALLRAERLGSLLPRSFVFLYRFTQRMRIWFGPILARRLA
jgi:hypothetical protein